MANGSNFAAAEKTGQGDTSHAVKKGVGFVVSLRKRTLAAVGAGKEQRPAGAATLGAVFLQRQVQFLVGRLGIAQMELHGLARAQYVADCQYAVFVIYLDDVTHEKFVGFRGVFYFRAGNAQEQTVAHAHLIAFAEAVIELG